MKPLCACGCGKRTSVVRGRSNDVKRGIVAGTYRKYASRECYYNNRLTRDTCKRGHPKIGRRCRLCNSAAIRVKKYGVSWEVALSMPDQCEICGDDESPLQLDHDHKTQKFRGWLCQNCNVILGHAEDDITILRFAIKYLKERA